MKEPPPVKPILSRPLLVETVTDRGVELAIEATPAEREELRKFNGLVALDRLRACFTVRREGGAGLHVSGDVFAAMVQTCVLTLEPFAVEVCEPVSVHYLQPDALDRWREERVAEQDGGEASDVEAEEPDLILSDRIDPGVLAAEYLSLAVDPYPKKPGIRFDDVAPVASEPDDSPFAVLKSLRPDDA